MKAEICALIVGCLLAAGPVAADSAVSAEKEDTCRVVYDMSILIMTKRQDGAPMPDMMALIDDTKGMGIFKLIIADAFEHSLYSSKEVRNQVIGEFGNTEYMKCLKAIKN